MSAIARAEPTRARYPDAEGYVERDGIRVFYEVYGEGEPTILLLAPFTLVHSRIWKMQLSYLSRHYRVATFDPRGNGRSDRPTEVKDYDESELARDALDVLDAIGAERAVIVGLSRRAQCCLLLAAEHPGRVSGAAFVGPWFPASRVGGLRWRVLASRRLRPLLLRRPLLAAGWAKFNAHLRRDYRDFVEWFNRRCTTQAHSARGLEDGIAWSLETDAETMILALRGEPAAPATRRDQLALARRLRCPVLVINGSRDRVNSFADARALARATGGRLVPVEGGDHAIAGRRPVEVNLARRDFVDSVAGGSRDAQSVRAGEEPELAAIEGEAP